MAQDVLGVMPATTLCETNPDDPGDLTLEYLTADMWTQGFPNATSAVGSLAWWCYQKSLYSLFSESCYCNATSQPPPPPVPLTDPSKYVQFPTDYASQYQLDRVEKTINTSSDGLRTVYLAAQSTRNMVSDMRARLTHNYFNRAGAAMWTMQGEGYQDLPANGITPDQFIGDQFGIYTELTSIPSTVARRGTLNPRLYGVGSIEWDVSGGNSAYPQLIAQRDALHYERQFLLAPTRIWTQRVYWRLQPGVTANAYPVFRSPDYAYWPDVGEYPDVWTAASQATPPDGFTDPPFYPVAAAARAPGGGLPP
jgi:hypothetical protein